MSPKQTATILLDMARVRRDGGADLRRLELILTVMAELLDEGDEDDMWGTEGWRHRVGLDS